MAAVQFWKYRYSTGFCIWFAGIALAVLSGDACGRKPASAGVVDLSSGRRISKPIRRGEVHCYRIKLRPGYIATIDASQFETDIAVTVYDQSGNRRAEADLNEFGRERVVVIARVPETLTVRVQIVPGSTVEGTYRLQWHDRSLAGDDEARVRAQREFRAAKMLQRSAPGAVDDILKGYTSAALAWRGVRDPLGEATALLHKGRALDRTGRREEALACYLQSLALWDPKLDAELRLVTLRQIGLLEGHLGERISVVPANEELLRRWRIAGDRRGIAGALGALSGDQLRVISTSLDSKRSVAVAKAVQYSQERLAIYRQLGDLAGERSASEGLVGIYEIIGENQKAIDLGRKLLEQARQSGDRRGEAASVYNLAFLEQICHRYDAAASLYKQALALVREHRDRSAEMRALHMLAWVSMFRGRSLEAVEYARQALALELDLRSEFQNFHWREQFSGVYENTGLLVQAMASADQQYPSRGYARDAFVVADSSHSRTVLEDALFKNPEPIGFIQSKLLNSDTVLIEYLVSEGGPGHGWVLDSGGLDMFEIPPRETIRRAVADLQLRMEMRSTAANLAAPLRELSRMLLEPARRHLGHKTILFVADDAILRVPVAILPDPNRADAQPLLAEHNLEFLPSALGAARARASGRRQTAPSGAVAVLADPVFSSSETATLSLNRLAFAKQEAMAIASAAPSNTSVFLGPRASKAAFLGAVKSNYAVIHVATHGLLNNVDPNASGLLLATVDERGNPVDGLLRLQDIFGLRTSADLVVLSACDSGVGKLINGEGMLSLTNGFLHAGAGSVLASLWKIDDEATAEFMRQFYGRMQRNERLPPSRALRATQLEFAHHPRWNSPYYWAGFTITTLRP